MTHSHRICVHIKGFSHFTINPTCKSVETTHVQDMKPKPFFSEAVLLSSAHLMLTYPAHERHRTSGLDWLIKESHLNSLFYDYIFKQVELNARRSKLFNDSIIKLQYIASIYNISIKLCTQYWQGFNM